MGNSAYITGGYASPSESLSPAPVFSAVDMATWRVTLTPLCNQTIYDEDPTYPLGLRQVCSLQNLSEFSRSDETFLHD